MKHISIVMIFIFLFLIAGSSQNIRPSIDTLKKHVYYLASAELKGRECGKPGQKLAAIYIATNFRNYGLSSFANNSYFHSYRLQKSHKNTLVVKSGNTILFNPWHFVYASGYNHADTVETKLIFAGYGSDAEIRMLNTKGNAIAFIAETPNGAYQTILRIKRDFGNTNYFVIFADKNEEIENVWNDEYQLSRYSLPEKFDRMHSQSASMEWIHPTDSINIYYCFQNVLQNFFMMDDSALEKITINNRNQNYSLLSGIIEPDITCFNNFFDSVENIAVENVGGYIKGADTTRTVIVSAHFDHVGESLEGINFGADDNASGTSALLECARLMGLDAMNGIRPKTNVLFMAFSGEELGLLGSEALVSDTSFNLKSVTLNINMDMIGRWDDRHEKNHDFVYLLTDGKIEKELFKIGKSEVNLTKGFEVSDKPGLKEKTIFKYGSDHYSFLKRDIPVSVFFTGLHDDYHTPRDTPDKINYENLTNITNLVYQYIYKVAGIE